MNDLQVPLPTMESVESVDVSWLHHSQRGQLRTLPVSPGQAGAIGFGVRVLSHNRQQDRR